VSDDQGRPSASAGGRGSGADQSQQYLDLVEQLRAAGEAGLAASAALLTGGLTGGLPGTAGGAGSGRPDSTAKPAAAKNAPAGPTASADPLAAMRALLSQAALPAAQLDSAVSEIKARREQVQALRTQLDAFDKQLETLEATLLPLQQWSRAWLDLQRAFASGLPSPPSGPATP
jgi:hypothetical protein